ncbi:MAG: peptide chain release factor-like protein [Gemmataceae bacterium]|nr:peptide chain release factor-like protein [Gemmataceae bacterium]
MSRRLWTALSDDQLLRQCEVDVYRASGPGGQKRNKTSSAVRLRHGPSGVIVIAEESRSQHANKAKALRRLRQALQLRCREPLAAAELAAIGDRPEIAAVRNAAGRLDVGSRDPRYWDAAALILDVLDATAARVRDSAAALRVTSANLLHFLQQDPKVWEQANALRRRHGQNPLRAER